jgi:hypothetical protein
MEKGAESYEVLIPVGCGEGQSKCKGFGLDAFYIRKHSPDLEISISLRLSSF